MGENLLVVDRGVEIVWVGDESGVLPDNHGHAVEMILPPMGFLNKLFDKFDYTAGARRKLLRILSRTSEVYGRFQGQSSRFCIAKFN